MAVTQDFNTIKVQLLLLEPDLLKSKSDEFLKEYIEFSTEVVNRDIALQMQNQAVIYLTLHYIVTNKGTLGSETSSSTPEGTYLSEKKVGDVSVKYSSKGGSSSSKSTALSKTKYFEMYLMLKGEDINGTKSKTREALTYQGW